MKRETAIARLTVIGGRAVERLVVLVRSNAPPATRIAALRALEAIGDPHALHAVLERIEERDSTVALAAISTARSFLRSPRGTAAVDRLTQAALDPTRDRRIRIAAIQALASLEPATLEPLWNALKDDEDPEVRALADRRVAGAPRADRSARGELTRAAEGELPDDPVVLRQIAAREGETIALLLLHRLIERVREREAAEPSSSRRRAEWTHARAAVHATLAQRGSRLGLYDLRESLEAAETPLPVEFLAALTLVGDASCLESIATAYERARKGGQRRHDWWRAHLAEVFHAIVKRERITRRHGVMKRIQKRWPEIINSR